jgi:hypothetical protein
VTELQAGFGQGASETIFVQIFERRNEARPSSYSTGSGFSSLQGKATANLKLTIRLHLVPSLRMSEVVTLIPHIQGPPKKMCTHFNERKFYVV